MSKSAVDAQICSLFGGRIAEELINGPDSVTTGASNDIERATQLARNMVTKWGFSDRMGPLQYAENEGEVFLGMSAGTPSATMSNDTAREIDEEIREVIDRNYARAKEIVETNLDKLHAMAKWLIEYETLSPEQVEDIMTGNDPRPPEVPPEPESDASKGPTPDADPNIRGGSPETPPFGPPVTDP